MIKLIRSYEICIRDRKAHKMQNIISFVSEPFSKKKSFLNELIFLSQEELLLVSKEHPQDMAGCQVLISYHQGYARNIIKSIRVTESGKIQMMDGRYYQMSNVVFLDLDKIKRLETPMHEENEILVQEQECPIEETKSLAQDEIEAPAQEQECPIGVDDDIPMQEEKEAPAQECPIGGDCDISVEEEIIAEIEAVVETQDIPTAKRVRVEESIDLTSSDDEDVVDLVSDGEEEYEVKTPVNVTMVTLSGLLELREKMNPYKV